MTKMVPVTITLLMIVNDEPESMTETMKQHNRWFHVTNDMDERCYMTEKYAADVNDYFEWAFGRRPELDFQDYPLLSVCGQACVQIIDAGKTLYDIADSAAENEILAGVEHACSVICFG